MTKYCQSQRNIFLSFAAVSAYALPKERLKIRQNRLISKIIKCGILLTLVGMAENMLHAQTTIPSAYYIGQTPISSNFTFDGEEGDLEEEQESAIVQVFGSSSNLPTCTGNADAVASTSGGAFSANLALGVPNSAFAQLDNTGTIVLDLTDDLDAGSIINITYRAELNANLVVEESTDASSWSNATNFGYTAAVFVTSPFTTSGTTRYLRFTLSYAVSGIGGRLDGVAYSSQPCGGGSCSVSLTQNTQSACNDNGTSSNPADDYFTTTFNATTTGGGTMYQVVLGANADGTGGTVLGTTNYGSSITVGNDTNGATGTFNADGTTTYNITVRDASDPTCHADYTTTAISSCSSDGIGTTFPDADYTIDEGGTVNTCSGVFADSGDTNGDYIDSETQTMIFCSDQNNHLSFTFEHFNTEATNDILSIYDGNSTGATKIGDYSGAGPANSPGVVTSLGTCLTFEFTSNGSTTSPGWIASISCTGLTSVSASSASWTGYPTSSTCGSTAQIGGTVYEDIDNDGEQGSREPGIYSLTVTLFDNNGQVGSPETTDANGAYTFSGLTASTVYRVEFTIPDNFTEGAFGSNSGTAVQFIESGRCDANLGLADAAHYCGNTNPYFAIPCYANGDPQHTSNAGSTGIARFEYTDSGDSPTTSYANYVTIDAVGTIWGVAYDGTTDNLYMSSVLKRHAGLGPDGIGTIYAHNDSDANSVASTFYDFGSAAGTVANTATRFPGTGNAFGQEGPCGTCDNIDPTTFAQVGKVGFGDIDINPENNKLYVSNLYDRKIYAIDLDNPTAGSATPLPNIPWLDNSVCSNGIARPWALEFRRGKLYVGVVCDASFSACELGTACSDLTAEIYSFDGTTWANELSFALDYYRTPYRTGSSYFVKWVDDWNVMEPYVGGVTDANFAQPIIMDLEIDDDNSIIIGIGDRTGYQLGYRAPNPNANSSDISERNMVFGDILRADYNNTTGNFTIENNGTAGNLISTNTTANTGRGGKSFYWGDYWTGIGQTRRYQGGIGALMMLPNSGEVAFSLADAVSYYSNGVMWMNNTNGAEEKVLEVYQGTFSSNSPNFAKSAGVGDMTLFCDPRPIEIGNVVWWDDDLDGLQDPNEPGINGVTIELYKWNGSSYGKVAETTSDTYGRYVFSSSTNTNGLNGENWSFTSDNTILPNTQYQVRIPNWNSDAGLATYSTSLGYSGLVISPSDNQGITGEQRDNDGIEDAGNAVVTLNTGDHGANDHSFDFGFGGIGGCNAPEVTPTANTLCDGETLNLMAAVSGGISPYTYNWSGPNGFTSTMQNPNITNADSALYAGIYNLTVTDNLGCEDTTHIHVAINKITISATAIDATCGGSDGFTDLTIDVGVFPFIIDWNNDGTGDNDDTQDLTDLTAGSYLVTVADADGCTETTTVSVGSMGSVMLTESHIDETCTMGNGSINLTITGAYTSIDWDNDGTGDNDDAEDLSGLSAGTYNVTVNNASNCPATFSVTLTDTSGPSVSATQVNTTCGSNNGSIDLSVSGGVAPYTYDWDNDGTGDVDDTQDLSNLSAFTYNVTVTDVTGCTATISVTLTDTAGPSLGAVPSNETCGAANGSIALTVSNGTMPFTYAWSNGLTTEDISGLGAGTFHVTVTDANGCTATTSATISNTAGPELSLTTTNATDCNTSDGSINLTISGGTAGYTYDWDTDGYEVIDNDIEDLSGLSSGSYMVIVTDANGCQATIGTTLLNTNAPVLSTVITDPTTCIETGTVDLTVTGGVSPFTYDWSNDGLGDNDDMEDMSGLVGGVYKVVVTGADGCTAQINASAREIRSPILNEMIIHPTCGNTDGQITLSIEDQDGSGPYTFDWDNDGTGDNNDTQNQTGLSTGNYNVTVTNSIGCTAVATYSLAPTTAAPILTIIIENPTCDNANGSIDMIISGGTPAYAVDWDNDGIGDNDDMEDLNSLSVGTYNVTVTDNGGCQTVGSVQMISSELPILNAITSNTTCASNGGTIDLTVDGIAPFLYDWDNDGIGDNDDTEDLTGLNVGNTYNVTVTDGNGCPTTATFSISGLPTLVASSSNPTTCGGSDGSITLSLTNVPDGIYTINYMDAVPSVQTFTNVVVSSGSATISGLSTGTYNDLNIAIRGCSSTQDVDITLTEICLYDWGDLPDTSSSTNISDYQTLSANNGPAHQIISGLSLGATVDNESDGQPNSNALGDGADEDGLAIYSSLDLYPNMTFKLPFSYVNTTGDTAHVEAWIDWNGDGDFDGSEMVADWEDSLAPFPNLLAINVPSNATQGRLLGLRIRISNQDNMTPYGIQPNGEVEDYLIGIACPQVCLPIQVTIIRQ